MDSAITALKKDDRAGFAKNMVEILPAPTSTLRHELLLPVAVVVRVLSPMRLERVPTVAAAGCRIRTVFGGENGCRLSD